MYGKAHALKVIIMSSKTICKTVHQYSKYPIPVEDMEKLYEIANDYCKVKNYVYTRYGGIGSLSKLYPGYTVQNEMTKDGLRAQLGLPSVYFYLAMFDALGDIRCQWTHTKSKILELVNKNASLSFEEKHYLRFLMKVPNAFEAVLNQKPVKLPKDIEEKYENLAQEVDTEKLGRYLCRQVRKYHTKIHTDAANGFAITERAYRYGEQINTHGSEKGIYISTKEKRKRIFVPLTDSNQYKSQLYIKLKSREDGIEIDVPVNVTVHTHADYTNEVGISVGILTMLTTDQGHSYGEELGKYQTEYAEWMRKQTGIYKNNRSDNPGRKKYNAKKRRLEEQMHSYINHELNRFLQEEQPETVYIAKLPKSQIGGRNKKINNSITMWQRGYIRKRLEQKCEEQSVKLMEVFGKGISNECSCCGATGSKKDGNFTCDACGYCAEEKTNTARNVLNRGRAKAN